MTSEAQLTKETLCADCAGFDVEWMRTCPKHKGVQFCRGCQCPYCAEDDLNDEDYIWEDGDE